MSELAIAAVALGLLALAAYCLITVGARMMRHKGPLRLHRLAAAKGVALPEGASEHDARAAALATRRCAGCASHERCDELLAARDFAALDAICPNAGYLERLGK